ncbi:MAG: hypothetical protein KH284_14600 [Clostridiales bacterium]|nr:hypothetical protein [Clostridiales bacterium]
MNIFDIISNVQTTIEDCVDAAWIKLASPGSKLVEEFSRGATLKEGENSTNNHVNAPTNIKLKPLILHKKEYDQIYKIS